MGLPAREAAHAALGHRSTPALRTAAGAVAMTAWDLFLDPQMTAERYWRWERPGGYRGIPLANYAGWLLTSAGLMLALERLLPPARAERWLLGEYAAMSAMETVGFSLFFRDRTVAAVGATGMLPWAILSLVRRG
jgi:putative membrane protein